VLWVGGGEERSWLEIEASPSSVQCLWGPSVLLAPCDTQQEQVASAHSDPAVPEVRSWVLLLHKHNLCGLTWVSQADAPASEKRLENKALRLQHLPSVLDLKSQEAPLAEEVSQRLPPTSDREG
jgi:hypothetical protein